MSNFKFKIVGECTQYSYRDGKVYWFDCGWEYDYPFPEEKAKKAIENGEWILDGE